MSELSQDSLENMLIQIRKQLDDTCNKISAIPKYFIVRPSDLEVVGLTVDDVIKMIEEQNK